MKLVNRPESIRFEAKQAARTITEPHVMPLLGRRFTEVKMSLQILEGMLADAYEAGVYRKYK